MPRRLIIIILIVLILGVVGGTVALLWSRFRQAPEEAALQELTGQLQESETGSQPIVDPTGDDDNDGLNNSDERLWGTNSQLADTDGDGFPDGQEVTANHNPTIAGPNDALPAGFRPGQELTPLETVAAQPVAIDQFFQENLDLTLAPGKNLTEEYRSQVPEEQRTPDTLLAFARSQPIITKLPQPQARVLVAEATDSPLVLREYLEVAGNLGVFSNRTSIAQALTDLFGNGDTSGVTGLALKIRLHQESLLEQRIPASALNLHRLLLGYTELLAATYESLAVYPDDPAKSAVAMVQLETIDRQYYPLIEREVGRLESLSDQLDSQL